MRASHRSLTESCSLGCLHSFMHIQHIVWHYHSWIGRDGEEHISLRSRYCKGVFLCFSCLSTFLNYISYRDLQSMEKLTWNTSMELWSFCSTCDKPILQSGRTELLIGISKHLNSSEF